MEKFKKPVFIILVTYVVCQVLSYYAGKEEVRSSIYASIRSNHGQITEQGADNITATFYSLNNEKKCVIEILKNSLQLQYEIDKCEEAGIISYLNMNYLYYLGVKKNIDMISAAVVAQFLYQMEQYSGKSFEELEHLLPLDDGEDSIRAPTNNTKDV